jgi:HEAT repeat protein
MRRGSASKYNQDRAENLVRRLTAQPHSSQAGVMMNDLLAEFQLGFPLENLRSMLRSENQDVANVGAWIASELGTWGKPLLSDVLPLLRHPSKNVRFSIIDCILLWAIDGAEFSAAIRLTEDPESSVRWKAMNFLSLATRDQLQAALSHLEAVEPASAHVRGLRWLLSPNGSDTDGIKAALQDENPLIRKYAVVAATRMSKENRQPLSYAASLSDPDVENFANSGLRLLRDRP